MTDKFKFPSLKEQISGLREFSANPAQRIRTGLKLVDDMCGGPAPGEVFLVLGRSFTGKSLVGQHIIVSNPEIPSIFFSLEMPYITAIQRMYSMWSGSSHRDVQEMTEKNSLPHHLDIMAEEFYNHRIVDQAGVSLKDMSYYIKLFENTYGERPAFVVIDYLELLNGSKVSGEGYLRTEATAAALKDWAKQEEMRVFCLHQTNKQEDPWNPPTENSARGAGFTEADFVIGIYQKWRDPTIDYHEYVYEKNRLRVNVLKNRAYGNTTQHKDFAFEITPSLLLRGLEN